MCLTTTKEFDTNGVGWKVVQNVRNTRICFTPARDAILSYNQVLVDDNDGTILDDYQRPYLAGYHLFDKKYDAKHARVRWWPFKVIGWLSVCKVKYDVNSVVATGYQDYNASNHYTQMDVVVARKIYIYKPGFFGWLKSLVHKPKWDEV